MPTSKKPGLDAKQIGLAASNVRQLGDYLCNEAGDDIRVLEVGVALCQLANELDVSRNDAA